MFDEFSGITFDVDGETAQLLQDARRKARREIEGDTLKAKLSDMAGAVSAAVGLEAISKGMQTCAVAESHFEGYELKAPVTRNESRIPFYDFQAQKERVKQNALYESLKKAKLEEFARLEAREEWEAGKAAPATDTATPAPVVAVGASITRHSTKARRDTLTPVIELAQKHCRNPKDPAEVWATLAVLAEKKTAPLIGATEDGLQYLKGGAAAILNRKSLGQRLAR